MMGLSSFQFLPQDDINAAFSESDSYGDDGLAHLVEWFDQIERLKILKGAKAEPQVFESATVEFRDGGSLATVKRERWRKPGQTGGDGLWPQGLVIYYHRDKRWKRLGDRVVFVKDGPQRGGNSTRIKGFSRKSRVRLQRRIASLRRAVMPVFVTLTYPSVYPEDPKEYKIHLRNFAKRYGRKFEGGAFIWRLEFQKRGAPHFHLLCYGPKYKELREWVELAWYEVVGSEDEKHLKAGTRVERIKSWKHVMAYASKVVAKVSGEMSKEVQATAEFVGRWWGIYFRAKMPWAELKDYILEEMEAVRLLRLFRKFGTRWVRKQAKDVTDTILRRRYRKLIMADKLDPDAWVPVKRDVSWRAFKSLTVFLDASAWLEALPRLAVPDAPRRYKATGRPYDKPFSEYVLDIGLRG